MRPQRSKAETARAGTVRNGGVYFSLFLIRGGQAMVWFNLPLSAGKRGFSGSRRSPYGYGSAPCRARLALEPLEPRDVPGFLAPVRRRPVSQMNQRISACWYTPRIEALETRTLLSTCVVNDL